MSNEAYEKIRLHYKELKRIYDELRRRAKEVNRDSVEYYEILREIGDVWFELEMIKGSLKNESICRWYIDEFLDKLLGERGR